MRPAIEALAREYRKYLSEDPESAGMQRRSSQGMDTQALSEVCQKKAFLRGLGTMSS